MKNLSAAKIYLNAKLILQAGKIIRLIDFDAARIFKEGNDEDTRFLGTKGYAPPFSFSKEFKTRFNFAAANNKNSTKKGFRFFNRADY